MDLGGITDFSNGVEGAHAIQGCFFQKAAVCFRSAGAKLIFNGVFKFAAL